MRYALGRSLLLIGSAATFAAGAASAQGIDGQVGRFYEDGGWDVYRLGVSRHLTGPLGLGLHGNYLRRADGGDGGFAGISADVTGFKGGSGGPYLVAGIGGGVGSPQNTEFSSLWGSWSAGAGYQLFPASFLAFGAEARWRELSLDRRDGLEVTAGLSIRFGGSSKPRTGQPQPGRTAEPTVPAMDPTAPVSSPAGPASSPVIPETSDRAPARLRDAVIATAKDAMGRPYTWGGTGANGGGFDCSGLIQHAYGTHGITLPRTSADQAREGKSISKKLGSLAPGDLLTFSNRGGPVSHVGLYIGDGRFIHSASRGVQISVLSGEDPYGRWWFKRWVGVRRIIED
jgi:cell wall-associated NlpC family hydrolase